MPFGAVEEYSFVIIFTEQLTQPYLAVAACILLTHGRQTVYTYSSTILCLPHFKGKTGISILFMDSEFSKGLLSLK